MGRPPLKNTGDGTEFESVFSKNRRQKVCYQAEMSGVWNPMVHMILKSDLKMGQTSARFIPHLLLEDDCAHNHASYNCKLSDVLSNSNGVCRWARPIAGKMVHEPHCQIFFPRSLHDNAEIIEEFTSKIQLQYTV